MMFSHISDTHLGLAQYGSEEREQDVYDAFNRAVDVSVERGVDFVVFAGDIFNTPNPGGDAIVQMANALVRLKKAGIASFFILGEHDISRIKGTPVHYVYHNMGFTKYIGDGRPFVHEGVLLCGFDKIRKSEIPAYADRFARANEAARAHQGHSVLVLHQGMHEFHRFAGEMSAEQLPPDFSYYAMGHLHDHDERRFARLGGPVVYPGSTEVTTSEGLRDAQKGFAVVDLSSAEARVEWIGLDARPQFSQGVEYADLGGVADRIAERIRREPDKKQPVVEIRISGKDVDVGRVQEQVSRLEGVCLRCTWRVVDDPEPEASVLSEKPGSVDAELLRLSTDAMESKERAEFAVERLLPLLAEDQVAAAVQLVTDDYEAFRRGVVGGADDGAGNGSGGAGAA